MNWEEMDDTGRGVVVIACIAVLVVVAQLIS